MFEEPSCLKEAAGISNLIIPLLKAIGEPPVTFPEPKSVVRTCPHRSSSGEKRVYLDFSRERVTTALFGHK